MFLISLNVSVIKFIFFYNSNYLFNLMVESGTRDVQLDLHIKSLSLKVTEHTPVYVVWQRGK